MNSLSCHEETIYSTVSNTTEMNIETAQSTAQRIHSPTMKIITRIYKVKIDLLEQHGLVVRVTLSSSNVSNVQELAEWLVATGLNA